MRRGSGRRSECSGCACTCMWLRVCVFPCVSASAIATSILVRHMLAFFRLRLPPPPRKHTHSHPCLLPPPAYINDREQERAEAQSAYLSTDPIRRLYLLLALCEDLLDQEKRECRPLHAAMEGIEAGKCYVCAIVSISCVRRDAGSGAGGGGGQLPYLKTHFQSASLFHTPIHTHKKTEDLRGAELGMDSSSRAYLAFPQFYNDCRVLRTAVPLPSKVLGGASFCVWEVQQLSSSSCSVRVRLCGLVTAASCAQPPCCLLLRYGWTWVCLCLCRFALHLVPIRHHLTLTPPFNPQQKKTSPPSSSASSNPTRTDVRSHNPNSGDLDQTMELAADSPASLRHLVGLLRLPSRRRVDRWVGGRARGGEGVGSCHFPG